MIFFNHSYEQLTELKKSVEDELKRRDRELVRQRFKRGMGNGFIFIDSFGRLNTTGYIKIQEQLVGEPWR